MSGSPSTKDNARTASGGAGALAYLRCPGCGAELAPEPPCRACGRTFMRRGAIFDFLGDEPLSGEGPKVQAFYDKRPFPGYAQSDDAARILDRGRRSSFLTSFDGALPPNARLLDCGCGTAQVASFLALSSLRRTVVGVDGSVSALREAEGFRSRAKLDNLQLVRADLFNLPLAREAFDFVNCRGVVHHTADPERAIASVASHVAPGGIFVLGFYESMGRAAHCARRTLGRVAWGAAAKLDPILRRKDLSEEKREAWISDQYHHPVEHLLPLPWVMSKLRALGFEWVRSVPPAVEGGNLFEDVPEPSAAGMFLRRTGWLLGGVNDEDAGLVCVVVRKR